jgi:hypothetical protein
MFRVGDSRHVHDPASLLAHEVGIFHVLAPSGEDMIVVCPPHQPWFIQRSIYRSEADGASELWCITRLVSWITDSPASGGLSIRTQVEADGREQFVISGTLESVSDYRTLVKALPRLQRSILNSRRSGADTRRQTAAPRDSSHHEEWLAT